MLRAAEARAQLAVQAGGSGVDGVDDGGLFAAAGVRARLGMGLWGTAERTAGCNGLQVMC